MNTALDTFTWTPIGERFLPADKRAEFVARLAGVKWLPVNGKHPFSPGHGLAIAIREFSVTGVERVAYNLTWLMPERGSDYDTMHLTPEGTVDATILGIKTRLGQSMWFLDMGHQIVPIALDTPEG